MARDKEHPGLWLPIVMTFVSHGLVLTFLILFIIHTPIPPYPQGGGPGMEVNLGFSDDGMGDIQPDQFNPNPEPFKKDQSNAASNPANNDNMLTQNYDNESEYVKNKQDNKIKNTNTTQNNTTTPHINEPQVNPLALYSGNSGGSEGETGKPGDQGHPDGDPNAKNHYGQPGDGNSPGDGGKGNSWNLGNRKLSGGLPEPKYSENQSGKVVVEIYVDRNGKVVKANTGYKGTTISSQELRRAAYEAALKTKFNPDSGAPEVQRGTITYVFELQ